MSTEPFPGATYTDPLLVIGWNLRQKEVDELRAENERLKAAVTDIGVAHVAAQTEVERLRGFLKHLIGEAQDRDDIAQMDEIFAALGNE